MIRPLLRCMLEGLEILSLNQISGVLLHLRVYFMLWVLLIFKGGNLSFKGEGKKPGFQFSLMGNLFVGKCRGVPARWRANKQAHFKSFD